MFLRFAVTTLLYITIGVGTIFAEEKQIKNKISNQTYYDQLQRVFEIINKDYVQETEKQKMIDDAIYGMITSLDPHSSYYTDEDLEYFLTQIEGEFGGIGVEIMYDNGVIKVISPIDNLPAHKAGIRPGDYIVGVNDELITTIGFNKAVKEMRGEVGTKVKLLVVKEDESKPKEVELVRETVKIKPVKAHLEKDNIAYIRISTFNKYAISELKESMKALKLESKNNIKGIILDLRNNPGGPLEQAVFVSEYFINSGVIVSMKGRNNSNNREYSADRFVEKAPKVPMVVLINSGSASASEIVAGALKDHKRAIIMGTKSFGKGSVQTFAQVNHRAAIKITTAKYYMPSGHSIQAEGVEPDIIVEPVKIEYNEAKTNDKRFSEASLKNYLKNENKKDNTATEKDQEKDNIQTKKLQNEQKEAKQFSDLYKKDYQFARAYDLIIGLILSNKYYCNMNY